MEVDEFLYYLVGVKDALLQEINSELHLGLAERDVAISTIDKELEQKKGAGACMYCIVEMNQMENSIRGTRFL
jgi:hypothetical protein